MLAIAWLCQYIAQTCLGQAVPVPLWACAYLAKCEALDLPVPSLLRKALHRINHAAEQKVEEALDIIDKPERKDDGAFRKF